MGIWYKPNFIWTINECKVQDVSEQDKVRCVVNEPAFQVVSGGNGQSTIILTFVSASGLKKATYQKIGIFQYG